MSFCNRIKGIFLLVRYSTMLHLLPLGFHCVGGWWIKARNISIELQSHIPSLAISYTATKTSLCIPFLGIERPRSQIPLSCVCGRFINSQDRPTNFLQQNRQIDRGNI
jgi:hypothetical protein